MVKSSQEHCQQVQLHGEGLISPANTGGRGGAIQRTTGSKRRNSQNVDKKILLQEQLVVINYLSLLTDHQMETGTKNIKAVKGETQKIFFTPAPRLYSVKITANFVTLKPELGISSFKVVCKILQL